MSDSQQRMRLLREQLQQQPGLVASLPAQEGDMVRAALDGRTVYEIAQQYGTSEEAVWRILDAAARLAAGTPPPQRVETGGFGSDTDPGISGGYGATGFGSLEADRDPGAVDSEAGAPLGDIGQPPGGQRPS